MMNLIFFQHEHEQQLQRLRQKTAEYELEIAEVKREKVEAVSAQTLQKLRNGSTPSPHQQQEVGGATNGRSPSLDGQDAEDINDMSRSLERVSSFKIENLIRLKNIKSIDMKTLYGVCSG